MSNLKQINDKNRYKVIPRTLIFIFDDNERVLLIKRSQDKKLWAGLLNGIGGHIEAGEDILEAAEREFEEETALSNITLDFCGQIMIDVERDLGVSIHLFRGQYTGEILTSSEEGKLRWVGINDLEDEKVVEDLPVLIPRIYQYNLGDPLIIGKYVYDQAGQLRIFLR
jgi:8-oxo-dGTP diphosphatase